MGLPKVKTPLTPLRLVHLATGYPSLSKTWYLVASAAFSSCNNFKQIPKIYHMAIQQSLGRTPGKKSVLYLLKMANMMNQYHNAGVKMDFPTVEGLGETQRQLTLQLQDALLKSLVITGVPRLINSLMLLRDALPGNLELELSTNTDEAPKRVYDGSLHKQGDEHFHLIYNKVSSRVLNNLNTSYPDLHDFILNSCYGQILSHTKYVSAKDSSLVLIGALVPQDVNPQLKGHLRGALNVGNSVQESNEARNMAKDICDWCGVELAHTPFVL